MREHFTEWPGLQPKTSGFSRNIKDSSEPELQSILGHTQLTIQPLYLVSTHTAILFTQAESETQTY